MLRKLKKGCQNNFAMQVESPDTFNTLYISTKNDLTFFWKQIVYKLGDFISQMNAEQTDGIQWFKIK